MSKPSTQKCICGKGEFCTYHCENWGLPVRFRKDSVSAKQEVDHNSRLRQEAPATPEASALAPSQTERQTESLGRSTDSNIQPKETPSLTLEGLSPDDWFQRLAERCFRIAWKDNKKARLIEQIKHELIAAIGTLAPAEIGLRHEAKDVELREACEKAWEEGRMAGIRSCVGVMPQACKPNPYARKALEAMEVGE